MRGAIFSLAILALASGPQTFTRQQQPYTPKQGDAERRAITDALRAPVEKQLKQKVVFKIDHLRVQNEWAFLRGVPQRPDGTALDYRGTPYQDAIDAGAFDDGVAALLRKRKGRWQVVQFVVGATDVPYVGWDKKYRAPSAIFEGDDQ
jgi:hypothetical protein